MNYNHDILSALNKNDEMYISLKSTLKIIDNKYLQILLNNDLEWLEKQYFIKNITLEKDQGNTKYKITNLGKEYYYHPYKLFLKTEWKWYIPLTLSTISIFINIIKLFIS